MDRRAFIKSAGAFGAFNIVPAKVLWGATAPSNQLTRALIGFGCIAHSANHLPFKGSRLVGLCDPYAPRVADGLAVCRAGVCDRQVVREGEERPAIARRRRRRRVGSVFRQGKENKP